MDIIEKLDKMITDTIAVGNVETNLAQGSVDVVGGECPKGQKYCPVKKKCVPIGSGDKDGSRKDETTVSGWGDIEGSGQTRAVGPDDKEIEVLKVKMPGLVTRFNKLLGIYLVDEE